MLVSKLYHIKDSFFSLEMLFLFVTDKTPALPAYLPLRTGRYLTWIHLKNQSLFLAATHFNLRQ